MTEVKISDARLRRAAAEGMDAFVKVFTDGIHEAIGGEINAENMGGLNADQTTLLAYDMLRSEVMDGGFVQLIHNGYASFFFHNPFGRMMRQWGIGALATLMNRARKLYGTCRAEIERECTDEEFMALFEQFPQFDDLDDTFVECEEEWTEAVARYIDGHVERFATIIH